MTNKRYSLLSSTNICSTGISSKSIYDLFYKYLDKVEQLSNKEREVYTLYLKRISTDRLIINQGEITK